MTAVFQLFFCLPILSHYIQHSIMSVFAIRRPRVSMRGTNARDDRAVNSEPSEETLWLKSLSSDEAEPNKRCVCVLVHVCVVYVHVSLSCILYVNK